MKRICTFTLIVMGCLTIWITTTLAQDAINYGQTFIVNIDGTSPQPSYTFNATAGDQITIEAFTLTPGLEAQLVLSDANAELITGNDLITHRILNDGTYTITLLPSPGLIGQIALKLDRREPQDAQLLEQGQGVSIPLTTDAHQLFFFYPNGDNEITLCIHTPIPDFDFTGHLYNENGMQIAHIHHDLRQIQFTIPVLEPVSLQHFYEVELFATKSDTSGDVILGLNTCEATTQLDSPTTSDTFVPTTTPTSNTVDIPTTTPSDSSTTEEPTQAVTAPGTAEPTANTTDEPTQAVTKSATEEPLPEATIPPPPPDCPDQDADDVCDLDDFCPDQAGIQTNEQQANGCPDSDGDGFVNERCPDVAGTAGGCPDADGDAVADMFDDCPDQFGIPNDGEYSNGCPDADGDGVYDNADVCPNEPGIPIPGSSATGCPDSDGDGIVDRADDCPDEPGIPTSDGDYNGCPDSDGDGVYDNADVCPNEPGIPIPGSSATGCPDSDGDGIVDRADDCPDEPGIPTSDGDYNGCPESIQPQPDSDGDGLLDADDYCPDTLGTIGGCPDTDGDGYADFPAPFDHPILDLCSGVYGEIRGCPDSDGDSIPDDDDKCPNEPGDISNLGCPLDLDGDGVPDDQDLCPEKPAVGSADGCPE